MRKAGLTTPFIRFGLSPILCRVLLTGGALAGLVGGAVAQTPPRLPGAVEPGRAAQPPAPLPVPIPDMAFTFSAPPATPPATGVPERTTARFTIAAILVEGAQSITAADIRAVVAPFEGADKTVADLSSAARAIELRYRADGYVLARAVVPPQSAADGRFRIQVVEGYVGSITVEGGDEADRRLIESRLRPVLADRPASLATLERALLLVNDLPGIRATGTLRPGREPGAADLVMAVTSEPIQAGISVNNRGSQLSGPFVTTLDAAYAGLFGLGEQVGFSLSQTLEFAESTTLGARWSQPLDVLGLGDDGLMVSFNATYGFGRPGGRLRPIDVRTRSLTVGPRLSYPLLRTRARTITLDGGLTWSESAVDASPGGARAPLFRDSWRTLDARVSWVEIGALSLGGVSSASLGWTQGLPAFGARRRGDGEMTRADANPAFSKATLELRHLQPLPEKFSLALTVLGQLSTTALVPGEEFSLGGSRIGRGYDPSEISGDHGFATSIELRRDFRLDAGPFTDLQLYGFVDYGAVRDLDRVREGQRSLTTGGLGGRFTIGGGVTGGIEWAFPLNRTDASADTARGQRIFVDLSARF